MSEPDTFNRWWESTGTNSVILRAQALSAWMARAGLEQQPQPAEDPDEWVEITDPDHVLRSCDQLTATENVKKDDIVGEWQGCMSAEELVAVGRRLSERRSMRFRCRHRDLPKVEQAPQPQKTRVRLWIEVPTRMIMCRDKAPYGDWKELHHDAEGFYVEDHQ